MKIRYLSLGIAILLTAAIVAGVGAYLKYGLLKPLLSLPGMESYAEKSVLELPFLVYSDEALKFMVDELLSTQPPHNQPPATQLPPQTTVPTTGHAGTTNPTAPNQTVPPTTSSRPTEPPQTTQPPKPEDLPSGYPDFYFPEGVADGWFDDVLFIGDSRTVGLKNYARSGKADYFCDVGATVFNIRSKELSDTYFATQTLESLLSSKTYGKVFINLGLNEIGYPASSVSSAYQKLVDLVQQKQPNAVIILQGVMSVTQKKASQADYFSPQSIAALNATIRNLANGRDVFYVDCNVYFADQNGYLYASLTNDGYHPTGSGYRIWRSWIHWAADKLDV